MQFFYSLGKVPDDKHLLKISAIIAERISYVRIIEGVGDIGQDY